MKSKKQKKAGSAQEATKTQTHFTLNSIEEFLFVHNSEYYIENKAARPLIHFSTNYDAKTCILKLSVSVDLLCGKESEVEAFLKLGCHFVYHFINPEANIQSTNDPETFEINDHFLATLLGLSLSTLRGICFTKIGNKALIPPIPNNILQIMIQKSQVVHPAPKK